MLFVIVQNRNELKCLLTGKCFKRLRQIHKMEYYSAMKGNRLLIQTTI